MKAPHFAGEIGWAGVLRLYALSFVEPLGILWFIYLLPLFAVGVFVMALLAIWFMPWIDRGRYPDAIPAFQILALSAVISFVCSPHVNLLFREHDFRFSFWLMLVGVSAAVPIDAFCIVFFRVWGAALGIMLSAGLINLVVFLRARHFRLALALGRS